MKYFYIAIQVERNGKMYAQMLKIHSNHNLWYDLSRIPGICAANIMPTRKDAVATVDAWNKTFKYSGIYLFDKVPF